MRTIVCIDYWNFQVHWNQRTGKAKCDWTKLGPELLAQVNSMLSPLGLGPARLEGVRLYASNLQGEPGDGKMLAWMNQFLKRIPGWSVFIRERHLRDKPIHCRACGHTMERCESCKGVLQQAVEKGVDAAIVSDMLILAWEGVYDMAIILSQDSDFIPAVAAVQNKGLKVVNAGWSTGGNQLQQECWGSFPLAELAPRLVRA